MSAWTDARDNIKQSVIAAWTALSPESRAYMVGLAVGFSLGVLLVVILC